MKQFHTELETMDGWAPPTNWFTADNSAVSGAMRQVIEEKRLPASRLPTNVAAQDLRQASSYFFLSPSNEDEPGMMDFQNTNFFDPPLPAENIPLSGKNNLFRQAANMLLRIDEEHRTLLAKDPPPFQDRGWRLFSWSPQMVSPVYPAGVSLTVVETPEAPASPNPTNAAAGITVNNYYPAGSPNSAPSRCTNSAPGKVPNPAGPPVDFDPVQNITLSLSTVLNSADTQDRIDYVSTFIYVYPFQEPANADVVLEKEFWGWFFSYQLGRPPGATSDFIRDDLGSSFDNMRIQFRNVTTTVLTQNLNLGTVQRGLENDLSGTVAAVIPLSPVPSPATTASPSLTATSKVTSSMTETILKQLDQRSSYISPDRSFLRITQRGMNSVNLNGRFNEQVQLHVPPAMDPLYVIQTNQTAAPGLDFRVKAVSQPMYSRVDALVVSLVAVRHPTKLRRSTAETFGLPLEDAADNDFIVGVPYPSKVTLWRWNRVLEDIYASDLDASMAAGDTNNLEIYFDSPATGLDEAKPLYLDGFDPLQTLALEAKISNRINNLNCPAAGTDIFSNLRVWFDPKTSGPKKPDYFIWVASTNAGTVTAIRLGLKDKDGSSKRLKPFPADFFPQDSASPKIKAGRR